MEQFKNQMRKLYQSLSGGQRTAIALAVAATLAGLAFLSWQARVTYQPLYTSLSPEDGAAVMARLKETGVDFQLADGGASILVPSEAVAEARLEMAGAGLPKSGRMGFEIFDKTSLGITDFAEQINYQRALEGELERSIMSLTEVEGARVHITFTKASVFRDQREPAKASVLLKLRPGNGLGERSAGAITHLVAAAVEGLTPQAVVILDMHGKLLTRPSNSPGMELGQPSDAMVEYRRTVEQHLVHKIEDALRPLLGHGRFHADVSAECDYTSGEESRETFDPDQSVMVTQQRLEEATAPAGGAAGGVPGTASNLPRPRSDIVAPNRGASRLTESTSYQTSRVVRRTTIPQGIVKRLSVAVLVDHAVRYEGESPDRKRLIEPRTAEDLAAIQQLVAAAVGLDLQRGDQLTIQSLPFESTLRPDDTLETTGAPEAVQPEWAAVVQKLQDDPILLGAVVAAALVLVAALVWFVRRMRKTRARVAATDLALPAASGQDDLLPALEPARGALRAGVAQNEILAQVHKIVGEDPEISAGVIQEWLLEENR